MIVLVDELPFLNQIPMIIQVERWNCFTSSEMFQRLTVLELLYFLWQCFTSIFELQSGFVWSTQWSFYYLLLLLVWAEWLSNETMRKSAWIAAPPPVGSVDVTRSLSAVSERGQRADWPEWSATVTCWADHVMILNWINHLCACVLLMTDNEFT